VNIDSRGRRGPVTWLAAFGVALSTLILLALLAGWLHRAWSEHRDERVQRAAALTSAIARHVETVLTSIEGDLRSVSDQIRRDPSLLAQGDERLAARLRSLKLWSVSTGAINVFDADGRFVNSSVTPAELGTMLASPRLAAYKRELTTGSTVSPPMESKLLGRQVFSLTIGIYDDQGAFIAMAGGLVPTAQFIELFRSLKPSPNSAVLLLRDDGRELVRQVHPGSAVAGRLDEPTIRAAVQRDLREKRSGVIDTGGETSLLRIAGTIERFDLAAVAIIDVTQLAHAWLEEMWVTLLAFATLAALALGLNVAIIVQLARRERSLAALHDRDEQRFRDGIEAMADAFVLWDPQDRLVLWNARYLEIFPRLAPQVRIGLTYRELLTCAVMAEWPDTGAAELEARVAARLAMRGRPERITLELADGRLVSTSERRTAEGGVVCLFQDVTEERRVAAELEASYALFRDGIEAMHDGFVLLDSSERVVAWNQAFIDIAPHMAQILRPGIPIAESMRFSVERLAKRFPELAIDVDAELARRLAKYRNAESIEAMTATSGRQITISARRTSAGGTLLIYRDVTPIREAEARVQETMAKLEAALAAERETNAQHRRFVSMASHEFRTPLAIIDSATQRLASHVDGNEGAAKRLARIRAAVARMADMIDRTLSSTRLEDGPLAPQFARFDLVQLVREAAGRQQSISPDFAIKVACEVAQLDIVADRTMIEQVVVNLLSNAVKYSGASRRVDLMLSVADGRAGIAVKDYGVGVPAGEIGLLFTRYFRAATAMGISGTGIGLHLVKELVGFHGGDVTVESEVAKGSTFFVRLPLAPAESAIAAAA
jgi:signal transduction histidine kinase